MRLLSIELYKIRHHKSSVILLVIYFILLIAIGLSPSYGPENILGDGFKKELLSFPMVWHFVAYLAGYLKYFLVVLIISLITREFTYGTLKQNLIDGLSKWEFIYSKVFSYTFFTLLSTLVLLFVGGYLGLSFTEEGSEVTFFTDLTYLFGYFLELMGLFSLVLFLSMLLKRSGIVILSIFLWILAEAILAWKLNELSEGISRFFPLNSFGLVKAPFLKTKIGSSLQTQMGLESSSFDIDYIQVLVACVWIFVFILGAQLVLKRKDL